MSPEIKLANERMKFKSRNKIQGKGHKTIPNFSKTVKTPEPERIRILDRFRMNKPSLEHLAESRSKTALKLILSNRHKR
jgi:hypothetical protein